MIQNALKANDIHNYKILGIPDIHNPPKWVDHVLSIFSDFDILITNDDFTKQLFSDKKYDVKKTKLYDRKKYSGKTIRTQIALESKWNEALPLEVIKVIKNIDGVQRIKSLSN